ncbi:sulfatase [Halorussus sp. GCM10023401]|uniref:sulfatase n=1 Tax=Halorussus sp. GCM10023401 TaxID=3252680 RepID=UPI0036223088
MGQRKPNVLLLVVDACRYDYLRGARAETPATDAFAEEATDFRRAISAAPWTLPSVTSMLTGKLPHEHGATSRGFEPDDGWTVVDDLREAGYECVHFSPKTWIGDWLPQGRGFDRVEEFTGPEHRYFEDGTDVRHLSEGVARGPEWYATVLRRALESENPAKSLGNAAMYKYREATEDAWLDDVRASERAAELADAQFADLADGDEPFFAYVHLMDPHLPFYVPEEFRSPVRPPGCESYDEELDYLDDLMDDLWAIRLGDRRLSDAELRYLRRRYADEVEYADRVIGEILDSISQHGIYDDTLVVLTADHGEHLGEGDGRTLLDHQTSVGLTLVRVPLLARYPGRFGPAERDDLVQTTHVAETVRALAGLEYDPARSLLAEDRDIDSDADEATRRGPGDADAEVALAEYAGVVPAHPPEGVEDERLFRTRNTAVAGEWKLDAVGDERRARRIDWTENETEAVPLDSVPARVRERLESALAEAAPTPPRRPPGEQSVPASVAENLEKLGYR